MKSSTAPTLFDLRGRTALITGSTRGIGLALAQGLAESGASVILNSRQTSAVDAAVAQLLECAGRSF
jgi:gluconate 5-dehydrogenase